MIETAKTLEENKIIAVIRASDHQSADSVARCFIEAGIHVLEITPNVSQHTKLIETLSKNFADVTIGCGSVTDGEMAFRAINSGAKFISSQYTDKNIISICKNNDIPVLQGASTMNEAMQAYEFGADFIRIFPINFLGGVPYLKQIKKSFPFLKLIPAGGIGLEEFIDYLRSGAICCAIGQALYEKGLIRSGQWSEVTDLAKLFVNKLDSIKLSR